MEWSNLKNLEVKDVFYYDENARVGLKMDDPKIHLIEYGCIIFEFTNGLLIEVLSDDMEGGVFYITSGDKLTEKLVENSMIKEELWANISNKKIYDINIYRDFYLEQHKSKKQKKYVDSTIEIVFIHGGRVFISNAGYVEKDNIQSLTDDFIVYDKKRIGMDLGLI